MTTRKLIEQAIVKKSDKIHKNGYVLKNSDNLINGIHLDLFYDDLMQGSGNELISKFNAIYSSAALAVNNFAFVKEHLKDFSFLEYSDFSTARFERQFKTGLSGTPPNLDFALESKDNLIVFESKYLELLDKKKADFRDSYNRNNLKYLNEFWFSLIEKYKGVEMHLDVAQLIKHSIGLINYKMHLSENTDKKVVLVYIYWTPGNLDKFYEYQKHSAELNEFNNIMNEQSELEFRSMTYSQFWSFYSDSLVFREHFINMEHRYNTEI